MVLASSLCDLIEHFLDEFMGLGNKLNKILSPFRKKYDPWFIPQLTE